MNVRSMSHLTLAEVENSPRCDLTAGVEYAVLTFPKALEDVRLKFL